VEPIERVRDLSLQTLGWGRYLAERHGQVPILWQAITNNPLLRKGYLLLVPGGLSPTPTPIPTRNTTPTTTTWSESKECEYPDEGTVGQMILRSDASGSKVHGQFGTTVDSLWPAKSGYVKYNNINFPKIDQLYLKLRYSKFSPSPIPILIFIDDEPRATLYPIDQGSWDKFAWTEPIHLGSVASGVHSIKFYTDGQQYGVADLDEFVLTGEYLPPMPSPAPTPRVPMPRNPGR
jgi:hypothetical protein